MIMENDGIILKVNPWEFLGKKTGEVSVTLVDNEYGENIQVLFTKPDIDEIVNALYEGVGYEIIPLRDELIAFARFNDPDADFIEEVVDDYLAGLKEEDVE